MPVAWHIVLLLTVAQVSVARASEPTPAEVSLARDQFKSGVEAAKAGHWQDAHDAFARAFEITPTPMVLLNLAGARAQTGRLVEASESYRQFLRLDPSNRHRAGVEKVLEELVDRIPGVLIEVSGLLEDDLLHLDDTEISRAVISIRLPVNPGDHLLAVLRGGTVLSTRAFSLAESEERAIHLEVPPPPSPPAKEADPPPLRLPSADPDVASEPGILSSPLLWVITGASMIAAGITLGIVLNSVEEEPYHGTSGIVLRP